MAAVYDGHDENSDPTCEEEDALEQVVALALELDLEEDAAQARALRESEQDAHLANRLALEEKREVESRQRLLDEDTRIAEDMSREEEKSEHLFRSNAAKHAKEDSRLAKRLQQKETTQLRKERTSLVATWRATPVLAFLEANGLRLRVSLPQLTQGTVSFESKKDRYPAPVPEQELVDGPRPFTSTSVGPG